MCICFDCVLFSSFSLSINFKKKREKERIRSFIGIVSCSANQQRHARRIFFFIHIARSDKIFNRKSGTEFCSRFVLACIKWRHIQTHERRRFSKNFANEAANEPNRKKKKHQEQHKMKTSSAARSISYFIYLNFYRKTKS